jgi:chemotaxis protein MotB
MAGLASRRRGGQEAPYWPGFVDAMAQLLLVITFLLSVFMVAQFLLAREISGQDTALVKLRSQIAELTQLLALERSQKAELELSLGAFTDDLAAAKAENAKLLGMLETQTAAGSEAGANVGSLQSQLESEKEVSAAALAQVELLNQQIAALRRQLAALNEALEASEAKDAEAQAQITDLGKRLNTALAQKVQELARYRSEFFGRLRKILSQRDEIQVVGDRFVFQSEVLFPKGSAVMDFTGNLEMDKLAIALNELEQEIPDDISWVLRVDGHTDSDPIQTSQFKSNWELSAARAIEVVKYLVSKGVSPEHLVAAGFGEFQPIDPGTDEDAKTRNRRIELKLTER